MPLPFFSYDRDLAAFGISDHTQWEADEQEEHELTNPIHPIWQQDNIRVGSIDLSDSNAIVEFMYEDSPDIMISELVYERLKPAFQLASLMLEASEPFFAKVYCANVSTKKYRRLDTDLDGTLKFRTVGEFDHAFDASQADRTPYRWLWTDLETCYKVMLRNDVDQYERSETAHARTNGADNMTEEYGRTGDPEDLDTYILTDIEPRFWEFFRTGQDDDPFCRASAQDRNRYYFDLAVLLLHELVHVVWMYRHCTYQEEVLYDHRQSKIELGRAWETYFLGGIIEPFKHPLRIAQHAGSAWHLDQYFSTPRRDAAPCRRCATSIRGLFRRFIQGPACWIS